MRKQPVTTADERKMKFAEAGILFVLVLALTIFVGVRVASQNGQADDVAEVVETAGPAAEAAPIAPVTQTVVATSTDTVVSETPDEANLTAAPPRLVTYAMAEQSYLAGDYAEAVALFDAYTSEHSANAWGFYMLGLSEWKSGDLDAAEEAFIAALDLKPDHVKSLINYGRVLLEQERFAAAREQIELALQSAPENVDANRVYSRICHNEGGLEEAADGYLKALRSDSEDVWSLNNLGLIRIQQERFDEALAPLAKAASLAPAETCIQNNLGIALERTGHFTAAIEAYEMALTGDTGSVKAAESRDRVAGLTEAVDLEAIDLIALAASFSADPAATELAELEDEFMEVLGDMEVAAAPRTSDEPDEPQAEQPQER